MGVVKTPYCQDAFAGTTNRSVAIRIAMTRKGPNHPVVMKNSPTYVSIDWAVSTKTLTVEVPMME